ncbi:MAG: tetratricopeptide repeat protein [Bacteroidia bacterium]|nr:tetratricopeptide repeat protein [Bacteroidia bacterium]
MLLQYYSLRISFLICFLITLNWTLFSQDRKKTDSLLIVLKNTQSDTCRVHTLTDLCQELKDSDPENAMKYGEQGLSLAKKISFKNGIATCFSNLGEVLRAQGNYPKANEYYQNALKIKEELGDKTGISGCYGNIGNVYAIQGDYSKATEYFLASLKIRKELGDKKGVSACYNNIGIIYFNRGDYPKAIEYYQKSLKIKEELGDKKAASACYINIGFVYYNQGSFTKAIEYYQMALRIYEETLNKSGIALCYNNIGMVHDDQGNYSTAIEYFQRSLKLYEQLGDKNGMSGCYNNIGIAYDLLNNCAKAIEYYQKSLKIYKELNARAEVSAVFGNISATHNKLKNYPAAIEYAEKGLKIAIEIGSLDDERIAYMHLYAAYKGMENYKKALENFELSKQLSDSIFNAEKHKQLAKMEAVYQNEKKQKEIEILEKDKKLKNEEIKRQTLQKYGFLCGFALMLILASVILFSYRKIKTQKHVIEEKNEELNQQNEEIRTQRDEIEAQRDLVTKQKEHIEQIHEELTDSIHYAERIQKAVLPNLNEILSPKSQDSNSKPQDPLKFETWNSSAMLTTGLELEIFVLFKPKDIVSGDFYWMAKRNNQLLIAVADCTGHGVPGAFMSMLGVSLLNEIVARRDVTTASQVLDELRKHIIQSLQQKGISGEQKDGMDIAFVALNTDTLELQFAGANNPVYIVETGDSPVSTVREIRPDKMPVAIHENMQPFTNHVIKIQKGDTIYLMSDGYADQFGGPKGRKFYEKQLKEILLVNSHLSMEKQKEILGNTIEDWKNNYGEKYEQTDDVTVFGIKI